MNPTHDQEVVYAKGCTNIEQLNELTSSSNRSNDNFKMAFFYNPQNDYQIYHITCESLNEISNNELPSDHTFYYKLDDKNLYKITCILISHSLIVQFLNKKMYGIELKQGDEPQQEFLTFSNYQRNNLESNLKEYLLASKQIKKSNVNVFTDPCLEDSWFVNINLYYIPNISLSPNLSIIKTNRPDRFFFVAPVTNIWISLKVEIL
ncbi:hypothetical protein GLOIN_2v1706157 [Rhizophagus irregularis DAOM 181602=DAOM 197198]|nr:hypothetical protein GLOIN_2v1706157 [Rhizophagus irregularis DAOM 181602=DAOM 197198]